MPKVQKSTDLVTTAFLPSVGLSNRNDLDLVAGRRELLVEIGRDAVNEFQRADPKHLVVGVGFRRGITSEKTANKTGSRRVKNDAAGMAILSANTTNPDFTRRRTLYRKPPTEGTIDYVRQKCRG